MKKYLVMLGMLCLFSTASWSQGLDTLATAPGYTDLEYPIPAPGSYRLPPLGEAEDGQVLNRDNLDTSLFEVFDDKIVLMAFIYSRCDDVNGCPLTSYVFYQIKSEMERDPQLADNLKLVSLSFDPEHDTAEVLNLYASNFDHSNDRGEWAFVSTRSEEALAPILKSYGQQIMRQVNLSGQDSYSHMLRVFLIDPERRIRNIYSVSFLHKELLLTDVRSLLLEMQDGDTQTGSGSSSATRMELGPGDDKQNYEKEDYQTRALAISARQGQEMDLLSVLENPPLGLPPVPQPADNLATAERIALGRKLFYDRRLSLNDTFSCAMCHIPEQGFSSNELATAVGIEGRTVRRNTPTIYNVAYFERLFHDGREFTLENQIWGPLLAHNEMDMPSVGFVINKIRGLDDYHGLFERAYDKPASMDTIGRALATYQRTLLSADSAFDRWYYGNQAQALSPSAKNGFRLFTGRAGCSACHLVEEKAALFTDGQLYNTGIGYRQSMGLDSEPQKVQLAPGVFVEVERDLIRRVGNRPPADVGLYEITENPDDRWKYRTPGLRNVALTAPYMHNGEISDLMGVVEFYDRGGIANELLDPRIRPLGLSREEKRDLVAFMQALTGSNVGDLVSDAFAAPIGDPKRATNADDQAALVGARP